MNMKILRLLFLILCPLQVFSQDSLVSNLANQSMMEIEWIGDKFSGEGWDYVISKSLECSNVLVGEDHFSNEIPAFVSALLEHLAFDNLVIEVDPYTTEIIEQSIKDTTGKYEEIYGDRSKELFSFYSLIPEYQLLTNAVHKGVNLIGAEQIVMYGDQLIFQDLLQKTNCKAAKHIYEDIITLSREHLDQFYKDPQNPMFFMTDELVTKLDTLESLDISASEVRIIQDIRKSINIYKQRGSHATRIKLIKHYLYERFDLWKDSRNLFKYGATHLPRGESFMTVYDVGNIVSNVAESNFEESIHIMIMAEGGEFGAPLKTFPNSKVDPSKGNRSVFQPFFDITENEDKWYLFDLIPLRQALYKGTLNIDHTNLKRTIKGYDVLIIIPKVTPAKF